MTLQKAGGLAALGTSGTYFVLVFIFAVVIPHLGIATPGDVSNPTRGMAAVASTPAPFFIINVTYLLFGLFDVLLFLALRE